MPRALITVLFACVSCLAACRPGHARTADSDGLVVCADPNNLPSSNEKLDGYENRLAQLVAADLRIGVKFYWLPQRRGFVRNSLNAGRCNVLMGVPKTFRLAETTLPYYRSTYVFVSREDRRLDVHSLDDPRLKTLRIGVHVIGADYASLPPVAALARRHIVQNVVGYSIYGDYSQPNPPAQLVDAVARGDVDVAIVWGPLAGYFAQRESVALRVTPIHPSADSAVFPPSFEIAMAVRRGDDSLRSRLNGVIERRLGDITQLLASYGVPLLQNPSH